MGRRHRGQMGASPRSMRRANWARRRRWVGPYIVRWRAFFTRRLRSRSAFTIDADFACSPLAGSITLYRSKTRLDDAQTAGRERYEGGRGPGGNLNAAASRLLPVGPGPRRMMT